MSPEYPSKRKAFVAGVSSLAILAGGPAVFAQDASDDGDLAFEEIVVTAQKRTESVEDVPIAISAYDANFTKRTNIDDVKNLVKFTPGFAGDSKDSFVDYINVRGISTNDFGVGGDPSVAFFKNGFYAGRNGSAVSSMFDMERAEVLRGPQGFLFGRSAIAGAISVHTAKPELGVTKGYIDVGVGERGIFEGEGAVNMHVTDNLAFRLAGYLSEENGYVTNIADPDGDKLIGHSKQALRASMLYEGDGWDMTVIAEREIRDLSGSVYRAIEGDETVEFFRDLGYDVEIPTGLNVNEDKSLGDRDNGRINSITATINVDLDFATLTSQTGYKSHTYHYTEDFDGTPIAINSYDHNQDGDYFEQELRLVGDTDGDLSWYGGLSYYREDINVRWNQQSDEDAQCAFYYYYYYGTATCAELWEYWEYPEFTPSPDMLTESNIVNGHYKGWGAYLDLNYALSDKFDVGVGIRYSKDTKNFTQNAIPPNSELGPWFALGFTTAGLIKDEKSWDSFTPRFTIRYRPNDDWNLYASLSRGFKSGGFGSFAAVDANGESVEPGSAARQSNGDRPQSFDPEKVWSWEVGAKGSLMDRRLLVDVSAYRYYYRDMQLTIFDPTAKVVNVGRVVATGVESTLQAILSENFDLYLAGSWNKNRVSGAFDVAFDSTGNRLPGMPKFTLAGALNFHTPVSDTGELRMTVDWRTQTKIYGGLDNNPFSQVDGWADFSLRVGYEDEAGWGITAYVENVFNSLYWNGSLEPSGEFIPSHYFGPSRPRTFGARLSFKFGE